MNTEIFHTRLESILDRAFEQSESKVQLTGTSSPFALALFLSQTYSKKINHLPHLAVVSSHAIAVELAALIRFFDPAKECVLLHAFDVNPYSGLYPNPLVSPMRVGFNSRASHAKPGEIFIATPESLMQRTIPRHELSRFSKTYSIGDELPENISEHLVGLGYTSAPMVEDYGQFSIRGGIVDIYPPSSNNPIRIELFGSQIESMRSFDPENQRSHGDVKELELIPAKEHLFQDSKLENLLSRVRANLENRAVEKSEADEMLRSLVLKTDFPGIEFLLPFFYTELAFPTDHFKGPINIWLLDPVEISRSSDEHLSDIKKDFFGSPNIITRPEVASIYSNFEEIQFPEGSRSIYLSTLEYLEESNRSQFQVKYVTHFTNDFVALALSHHPGTEAWMAAAAFKLHSWRKDGYRVFVSAKNNSYIERMIQMLDKMDLAATLCGHDDYRWDTWLNEQNNDEKLIHIIPRHIFSSIRMDDEKIIFLKDEDFWGKKQRSKETSASQDFQKQARRLSFGDLMPGDLVVHIKHGIGIYEGLKIMAIGGIESEFIQVAYKDKDKLYLPVYRVGQLQKFSGGANTSILDKLGGIGWEKTKTKVKTALKDIASELLQLYARRAEIHRPPFTWKPEEITMFENSFPYEETQDQLRAINDIARDFDSTKPMDRLVCGDVGFGKTEVAMRAAFFAVQAMKQVAVLAPTTVLTFQHIETFKKRFANWPVDIRVLNRFISDKDAKKTIQDLKNGTVDIIIGTHKLLGNTIDFKNLGLLIVDEEQKFGVTHKEKIKKLKISVDTLAMSATPIPRTLNMALAGVRDLSIINTAPIDRLPTRTFVCKFDPETIRKAIDSEISRGGQIYFIHNRIQSIYGLADEIRSIVPTARIRVAHGQLEEHELEKSMLAFFHHEIDILVCTAIVESGMDVPRANTMFIDQAHMFGLSQLYQLRGRVGRSKTRAYCYLILPKNKKLDKEQQERLKIIQENTALGSGFKIAQYDLELRGSGNILGDDQSGHVNTVGYELYMDLLNEALAEAKGEKGKQLDLDPEINLRISAMIPDSYIKDIRLRLSYYKALAEIESTDDLDRIEDELKDQFGPIPEATINLMGLMLIRRQCKELGIRDISAGLKTISLIFTEQTGLKPETVIQLAIREHKKYSITPDNRLNIRMSNISWSSVYEELGHLQKML